MSDTFILSPEHIQGLYRPFKDLDSETVKRCYDRPLYGVIQSAYHKMQTRKWDKMYWCIDIHDTIAEASYKADGAPARLLPGALAMLAAIMVCPENRIILWSSLKPEEMEMHKAWFFGCKGFDTSRVHLNCNPEEQGNEYADFSGKFYFNVLLDDKAGFDPAIDFLTVRLAIDDFRDQYMLSR